MSISKGAYQHDLGNVAFGDPLENIKKNSAKRAKQNIYQKEYHELLKKKKK